MYAINKTKLTNSEEVALMRALDEIKKLPNAQLEYGLKLMKQYFNEAATNWINTDGIAFELLEKFNLVKRATIEKRTKEFQYYEDGSFSKYQVEPYELRISGDIWKAPVRKVREKKFEEFYLARMRSIEVKSKQFSRLDLPGKYKVFPMEYNHEVCFKVLDLSASALNRFPIEKFCFEDEEIYLKHMVSNEKEANKLEKESAELLII